ncbi:aldo/keto reductase [Novosphingobium olei]|uniref:aldo/keto reductase n=1 Tax=Novosphingobium olei TaxID=2728851 RepID=UPI003088164A|nr:aldo/keto reductase [Novosphingobium olei]
MSELPLPPAVRPLGRSGIAVSALGWGMWRLTAAGLDAAGVARLVEGVLDAGVTLLDTADIYGFDGKSGFGDAEALLGQALALAPSLRSRMVLATKGGILPPLPYDQSPTYLQGAIEASLRRLKTDVIDLYQIHRPDILAHPQDVARVLDDAAQAGKIRSIGMSNFTPAQIAALSHFLDAPLVATQPEISPLRIEPLENGEMDQAMVMGLTPLAWSPLGGGSLLDPQTPRDRAVADALDVVADAQGVSRSSAAFSWLMAHPAGIVPIVGSQQLARVVEATQALTVRWTRAEWYAVLVASRGAPLP